MKEGKMMIMKDSKWVLLEKQMTCTDGCKVKPSGEVVMKDGLVQAEPGSGQFLARGPYDLIKPTGTVPFGFDASAFLV